LKKGIDFPRREPILRCYGNGRGRSLSKRGGGVKILHSKNPLTEGDLHVRTEKGKRLRSIARKRGN